MRLAFLDLPESERKVYIDEAAARRGLSPVIVEKDFWVCWLLSILFNSSFRDAIVFKGGTSLSKVFNVINRFSEDIDLSLAPAFLDLDEPDGAALSKGQANKWMERAEARCTAVVRDAMAPEFSSAIQTDLGGTEQTLLTFEVDAHSHSPVLLFHYSNAVGSIVATRRSSGVMRRRGSRLMTSSIPDVWVRSWWIVAAPAPVATSDGKIAPSVSPVDNRPACTNCRIATAVNAFDREATGNRESAVRTGPSTDAFPSACANKTLPPRATSTVPLN